MGLITASGRFGATFAVGLMLVTAAAVQAQVVQQPQSKLAGTIEVRLSEGRLDGDLCLHRAFPDGDTARFALHRGLNIKRVSNGAGVSLPLLDEVSLLPDGISVVYTVRDTISRAAPDAPHSPLCVSYSGAYPVYAVDSGDYRSRDGSDVIAFNGRSFRARGESRWFPAPLDASTGEPIGELSYRILVRCPECAVLYLNGAAPLVGSEGELTSSTAVEPLIFVGDYPMTSSGGVRILGEMVHPDTALLFAASIAEIVDFYEESLGVGFGPMPDFLRIVPVRHDRRGQFWGFFADPALGIVGLTIGDFAQILGDENHEARPPVLGVLAHELAHRYFASMLRPPPGEYQLYSEPFATYLDLQATRHFFGEARYRERLVQLRSRATDGPDLPAPDQADGQLLGSDRYRYAYAPLMLVALEQEVGRPRMWRILNALLTTDPGEPSSGGFDLLRRAALQAGVPASSWGRWARRCVGAAASMTACLRDVR